MNSKKPNLATISPRVFTEKGEGRGPEGGILHFTSMQAELGPLSKSFAGVAWFLNFREIEENMQDFNLDGGELF